MGCKTLSDPDRIMFRKFVSPIEKSLITFFNLLIIVNKIRLPGPQYLYQMVTQNMLCTHEEKRAYLEKKILCVTALDLNKCLKQIK